MNRIRYWYASCGAGRQSVLYACIGLAIAGVLLAGHFSCQVFAASSTENESAVGMAVGQRYPDITLPALDGRGPLSVSHFRGRKILLVQFASW